MRKPPAKLNIRKYWRRERNWDPTLSKFGGAELAQREELNSNCPIENIRE